MAVESSYTATGVVAINTVLLGPVDADAHRGLCLQVVSMGTSGVIKVQQSNDSTTWVDSLVQLSAGGAPASTMSAAGLYWLNLTGRYYRVLLSTATTAGTTTLALRMTRDEFTELPNGLPSLVIGTLPALPAGTSAIGKVWQDLSATVANGPSFTVHRLVSAAASTNATSVKASAGRIARLIGYNASTSVRYLKMYNKASAPTVGTDTPVLTLALKPSDTFSWDLENFGHAFSTGIAYALTTGSADSDTAALTAADVVGLNIVYI